MKTLAVSLAALISMFILASAHASLQQDQETIARHQEAIGEYAKRQGIAVPPIETYTYGMKLDVAKLVRRSPDNKSCQPITQLMTYTDSAGTLKTVQYRVFSECRNGN